MKLFNQKHNHSEQGFSLLEVLISVLILSIGLLGLAALHATSLKANHGAYHKSQATFLAYDIVDRLRANQPGAISGAYNITLADVDKNGTSLADIDVNSWLANVNALLPQGDGSIACTVTGRCTVVVTWNIEREGGTADTLGADASAAIQTFRFVTDV